MSYSTNSFLTVFMVLGSMWTWSNGRPSEGSLVRDLRVDCNKDTMIVTIDFYEPFTGLVYSRGFHGDPACRYVHPTTLGSIKVTFGVPLDRCGTSSGNGGPDMYLENILIIQADPDIQEAWDLAKKIRCVWRHTYARAVTAKPFQVFSPPGSSSPYEPDGVRAVMEVQRGRGPFSRPSSGYLHLGEESSLVVFVQDPSRKVDARMVDCRAAGSEGTRDVQLIDDRGCPLRPDLITPFSKTRDTRNTGADLIMFTQFRAFKIPDSSSFNIRCQMQVCKKACPDPRCSRSRFGRRVTRESPPPGPFRLLERRIDVLADEDDVTNGNVIPNNQVCLLESSWIAVTAAVTAGYLFLLLAIWILFWRVRAYGRLLFRESKMVPVVVER